MAGIDVGLQPQKQPVRLWLRVASMREPPAGTALDSITLNPEKLDNQTRKGAPQNSQGPSAIEAAKCCKTIRKPQFATPKLALQLPRRALNAPKRQNHARANARVSAGASAELAQELAPGAAPSQLCNFGSRSESRQSGGHARPQTPHSAHTLFLTPIL